jgi:hypothetical protein
MMVTANLGNLRPATSSSIHFDEAPFDKQRIESAVNPDALFHVFIASLTHHDNGTVLSLCSKKTC